MSTIASSWTVDLLPRLTAASGVGYLATAYTVSRWLTRRAYSRPILPVGLAASTESLACTTDDGLVLQGWVLTPATPRATVVLFHGLREDRAQLLDRMMFLLDAGYRCVAFDHRAHGESAGWMTSFGYHERADVHAIAELVAARWPDERRAALGVSMGAAALCFAEKACRFFDGFILESVYRDLASAFQRRVGDAYPAWFDRFRSGIIWVTERRLGLQLEDVAPWKHVAQLAPRPLLLVTGAEDEFAPPEDVRGLGDGYPGPCRFEALQSAGHVDVCEKGGEGYRRLILDFLSTCA